MGKVAFFLDEFEESLVIFHEPAGVEARKNMISILYATLRGPAVSLRARGQRLNLLS